MSTRRLRLGAFLALVLAIVLFVTAVTALRWVAVVLVVATIPVLLWTLVHPDRSNA